MSEQVRRQIDNYRLLRLLGEGAFGAVYLAEHRHPQHREQYALKILKARLSRETLKDFLNEARSFRLKHPNIMSICDFGIEDDVPFLVMDYVPGGTLRGKHPLRSRVPLKSIITYVQQIGEALQYAHDEGLVHRDVKPENMLVGAKDEVLLSDFGIVTTSYTWNPNIANDVAGTVIYMAPEQLGAKPVRASDQYALACIVYEWLVGFPPFRGSIPEVAAQHASMPPTPLHEFEEMISQEVEAVVLQGLAKDPRQRFASVREFAEALEQASKPPIGTTVRSFVGHEHWITAVAWSPDGTRVASGSSDKTVQIWDAEKEQTLSVYRGHGREVTSLGWSPDGTRIASASNDQTAQVWLAATGRKVHTYTNHSAEVLTVAWSPDSSHIASASSDKTVQVWEAKSGIRRSLYHHHTDDVCAVAWSPDGKYIASADYDGTVHVHEATTGNKVLSYHNYSGGIYTVAWSPDGKRLASAGYDGSVQIRETATGSLLFTYREHTGSIFALAWSPDGTRIASGGDDTTVRIWQYMLGRTLMIYQTHNAGIRALAWSPDGQRIASGGVDAVVHIWQAS